MRVVAHDARDARAWVYEGYAYCEVLPGRTIMLKVYRDTATDPPTYVVVGIPEARYTDRTEALKAAREVLYAALCDAPNRVERSR